MVFPGVYRTARKHLHGHHHGGRCSGRRTSAAWPPTPRKRYLPTSVPRPSQPPLSPWEKSRVKVRRHGSQWLNEHESSARGRGQALHSGVFLLKHSWEEKQWALWNVELVTLCTNKVKHAEIKNVWCSSTAENLCYVSLASSVYLNLTQVRTAVMKIRRKVKSVWWLKSWSVEIYCEWGQKSHKGNGKQFSAKQHNQPCSIIEHSLVPSVRSVVIIALINKPYGLISYKLHTADNHFSKTVLKFSPLRLVSVNTCCSKSERDLNNVTVICYPLAQMLK